MTDRVPAPFLHALDALPSGTVPGAFKGRRYVASKTVFNDGKSVKLVAEELGGRDYISLNLYRVKQGARLYPCEMSRAKVITFVEGFRSDPSQS